MGGMFEPSQTPAQFGSPFPKELEPFLRQLIPAVGNLFAMQHGVTPLEESTIRGIFQQADPARDLLDRTVRGQYLPGTNAASANPFLNNMMAGLDEQAEVARRQMGSAAQKAGALTGSGYMQQAADLEGKLATGKGQLLSGLYESERDRQMGAVPALGAIGQMLLGAAGRPREVFQENMRWPYQLGAQLLGNRTHFEPGKSGPSPFASLLSLAGSFAPMFGLPKVG